MNLGKGSESNCGSLPMPIIEGATGLVRGDMVRKYADDIEIIGEGLIGLSCDFYSNSRQVVELKDIANKLRGEIYGD